MAEVVREMGESADIFDSDAELWFEPNDGWIIVHHPSASHARCFSTGDSLDLEDGLASELLAVNNGQSASSYLNSVQKIAPETFQSLLQTAREGEFRALDSVTDCLNLSNPNRLWIELQGECNERCRHCYAESLPSDLPSLSLEVVKGLLEDANRHDFDRVQFTGGDPLLWDGLPEVVKQTREYSITPEIFTNGLRLSDSLYEQLEPAEPMFSFSFYSHDPGVHDRITNTPGSWERTRDAIVKALNGSTPVRVAIVIMEENKNQLESTIEFLEDLGVDRQSISWDRVQTVGRGVDQAVDDDAVGSEDSSSERDHSGTIKKRFNPGKLCVTYEGDVVPCIFQRWIRLGSVHETSLGEIIDDPTIRNVGHDPASDPLGRDSFTCSECQFQYILLKHSIN